MKLEDLSKHFPDDARLPDFLAGLLQWQNEWYIHNPNDDLRDHLGFELCDCKDALLHWFDEEKKATASKFAIFGHDRTGSMFGYWLYDGRRVDTAPVVILDSEGSPSYVMANSLAEFLQLVAAGDKELFSLPDFEAEYMATLTDFCQWLEQDCGILPPKSGAEVDVILQQVEENHPSLEEWLNSQPVS